MCHIQIVSVIAQTNAISEISNSVVCFCRLQVLRLQCQHHTWMDTLMSPSFVFSTSTSEFFKYLLKLLLITV